MRNEDCLELVREIEPRFSELEAVARKQAADAEDERAVCVSTFLQGPLRLRRKLEAIVGPHRVSLIPTLSKIAEVANLGVAQRGALLKAASASEKILQANSTYDMAYSRIVELLPSCRHWESCTDRGFPRASVLDVARIANTSSDERVAKICKSQGVTSEFCLVGYASSCYGPLGSDQRQALYGVVSRDGDIVGWFGSGMNVVRAANRASLTESSLRSEIEAANKEWWSEELYRDVYMQSFADGPEAWARHIVDKGQASHEWKDLDLEVISSSIIGLMPLEASSYEEVEKWARYCPSGDPFA